MLDLLKGGSNPVTPQKVAKSESPRLLGHSFFGQFKANYFLYGKNEFVSAEPSIRSVLTGLKGTPNGTHVTLTTVIALIIGGRQNCRQILSSCCYFAVHFFLVHLSLRVDLYEIYVKTEIY